MMKRIQISRLAAALVVAIILTGCSKERVFKVEGELSGDAPERVGLERLGEDGNWIEVATAAPDGSGAFDLSFAAPEYPDLFRVSCNGKYVYLPVDSTETFTLTAPAADISRGFKLSGSPQADAMTAFEAEALRVEGYNSPDSIEQFKRRVFNRWLKDAKANIFSYYVLTRRMGDGYLIDYTDPLYRAVATSFQTFRPKDPHTPLLAEQARKGLGEERRRKGKQVVIEAPETSMIEISLPGLKGENISLSSVLGKGKPVVVAFGGMTIPDAAFINMGLRKLYEAGRADIYQVCLDNDRFDWQRAAKALPWTVVFDPDGLKSKAAANYNLASVPAYFIYDAQGNLINSTGDISALPGLIP